MEGIFPDINIETKRNCLTLSKVSMWWRERGWRGKATTTNKKRLSWHTDWNFQVGIHHGSPRGTKGWEVEEGKGQREETKSVESCWRVTCKFKQSQILASYWASQGGEGKLVFLAVVYWKIWWYPQDLDFTLKYHPLGGDLSIAESVLDALGVVKW